MASRVKPGRLSRLVGIEASPKIEGLAPPVQAFFERIGGRLNRLVEALDKVSLTSPVPVGPFGRGSLAAANKQYNLWAFHDGTNGVNQCAVFGRGRIIGASLRFAGGTVPAAATFRVKIGNRLHGISIPSGSRNYQLRFEKVVRYDEDEDHLFEVLIQTGGTWGADLDVSALLWILPDSD